MTANDRPRRDKVDATSRPRAVSRRHDPLVVLLKRLNMHGMPSRALTRTESYLVTGKSPDVLNGPGCSCRRVYSVRRDGQHAGAVEAKRLASVPTEVWRGIVARGLDQGH